MCWTIIYFGLLFIKLCVLFCKPELEYLVTACIIIAGGAMAGYILANEKG